MKCIKCGYISFDHNKTCPICYQDLSGVREHLGMFISAPEVNFEEWFKEQPTRRMSAEEGIIVLSEGDGVELVIDQDDFEFNLDDPADTDTFKFSMDE
jgi:hypothetical protein